MPRVCVLMVLSLVLLPPVPLWWRAKTDYEMHAALFMAGPWQAIRTAF